MGCKGGAEIAVEIRAERSSPRNESGSRHSLFLGGAARSVLVDYREGLSIRSAGYRSCSVEKMACS